jgi:hypothetical protein
MNTSPAAKSEESTVVALRASAWGHNFIVFALLIDIMYRSLVFHETAWDLFVLLGLSGVVSLVYASRHKVPMFGWNTAVLMALGALIAAAVSAVIALTQAM